MLDTIRTKLLLNRWVSTDYTDLTNRYFFFALEKDNTSSKTVFTRNKNGSRKMDSDVCALRIK